MAMKHWFKDQHFRSLLKNSSYLAASRIVALIAGIATISFATHALGLLLYGALVLITSYAKAVSGIAKFQSWQLIVRYGAPPPFTARSRISKPPRALRSRSTR